MCSRQSNPYGVRKRRSTLTKASVSFVLRSLVILRTGISGWRMPIVNGSRAGLPAQTRAAHIDFEYRQGMQVLPIV